MNDAIALLDLNLVYTIVGTALLYGLGFVRTWASALRFLGLALLSGWAALGVASSLVLMAGASGSLVWVLGAALIMTAAGAAAGRRVPPRSGRRLWSLSTWSLVAAAAAGALLAVVYLGALLRRALVTEPLEWDSWAFWVPKAQALVYDGGLGTGPGSVSSFANPDYPPLVPALDALVFRFSDTVDPSLLASQRWVVAAATVAALAGLLWERVSPALLFPLLAVLVLTPAYGEAVASLLADEALAAGFALAGLAAVLWLLERDPRWLALFGLFAAAMSLAKNEGFPYALLMAALLALEGLVSHHRVAVAALGAPLGAILPWKAWQSGHDIPASAYYRFSDLLHPGFLADRLDRLGTAIAELPAYYVSSDRSLLVLPALAVVAALAARHAPRIAVFATATLVLGFAGNVVVYWISTPDVRWYIDTSAERTSLGPIVFAAALLPLLAGESMRRAHAMALDTTREAADREVDLGEPLEPPAAVAPS